MIRRVLSRFRMVAPPGWSVVVWLVLFAAFEGPVLYFEQQVGGPLNLPIRPGRILLIAGAALLGIYRVVAFHPYLPAGLSALAQVDALDRTQAIAAGPVELVPEDGLAIGGLILLSMTQPEPRSIELVNDLPVQPHARTGRRRSG